MCEYYSRQIRAILDQLNTLAGISDKIKRTTRTVMSISVYEYTMVKI